MKITDTTDLGVRFTFSSYFHAILHWFICTIFYSVYVHYFFHHLYKYFSLSLSPLCVFFFFSACCCFFILIICLPGASNWKYEVAFEKKKQKRHFAYKKNFFDAFFGLEKKKCKQFLKIRANTYLSDGIISSVLTFKALNFEVQSPQMFGENKK